MADPDLIRRLRELDGLSRSAHLFCEDAKVNGTIIDCLQLFAYDGPDVAQYQKEITTRIDQQLGKCDRCIIAYYKAKGKMIEELRNEYEEDEIESFERILDDHDIERIQRGLQRAASTLRTLPPEKQRQNALERADIYALFEALACERFLRNEHAMDLYFNETFCLIQKVKPLNVTHYVPALTMFVFGADEKRSRWSSESWRKISKRLTSEDFDFAVRDPLSRELVRILTVMPDSPTAERFWNGMKAITARLDGNLITHSLRAMDQDIYRLALDHLQIDGPCLIPLLETVEILLKNGPKDFWEAMGAIAPTTVIEQVFNSPYFDQWMQGNGQGNEGLQSSPKDTLNWISPFMESLQTTLKPPACRSLAFQLLSRLQADRFSANAKIECYNVGLSVISSTLEDCNDDSFAFDNVGRVVASDTLAVFNEYLKEIMPIVSLPEGHSKLTKVGESCFSALLQALKLECNLLYADRNFLAEGKASNDTNLFTPTIWQALKQRLKPGCVGLAGIALRAMADLTGLQKFESKKNGAISGKMNSFNDIIDEHSRTVCTVLESINDFSHDDLNKLLEAPKVAVDLLKPLFSAEQGIYEAAIDLIKTWSGESVRKDAIRHVLQKSFDGVVNGVSWVVRRITQRKAFGPCPRMLKSCNDIVDVLCDSQDGILRGQSPSNDTHSTVETFWRSLWESLDSIYKMTETWATDIRTAVMVDFCRDVMQFSEHLVDQFTVFDSVVKTTKPIEIDAHDGTEDDGSESSATGLLVHPSLTLKAMIKYLKLRDEYLLSTSVKLIHKLLLQLSSKSMNLTSAARDELEMLVVSNQRNTNMTDQQKAEIRRALEENLGHSVGDTVEEVKAEVSSRHRKSKLKQGAINMGEWVQKAKVDSDLEADIASLSSSVEKYKAQQAAKLAKAVVPRPSPSLISLTDRKPPVVPKVERQKAAEQEAFLKSREQAKKEKRARDAEAVAKAKKHLLTTSEEGSALGQIGNLGRDHAPKGTGIMVSSESESDGDDEIDQALFGPKKPKQSAAVAEYNASRQQQIASKGPVKKTKQIRTVKDMRARVAPDLSPLHCAILNWDFFHDGDFPPGSSRDNYALVTNKFRSAHEYRNTFEPLLLLEAWQSFRQAREETNSKPFPIKVVNRMSLDQLVEVSSTLDLAQPKELGLFDGDIVLLSKSATPTASPSEPHCLARIAKITRKSNSIEITFRVAQGRKFLTSIIPKVTLYVEKVTSITPLEREYGALLGLVYFDLCDEVIKAYPSPLLPYSDQTLGKVSRTYELNKAQAKAVQSTVDNDAFTLIQGPPGSGKTKTIVAIVGALLTDSLRYSSAISVNRPRDAGGVGNGSTAAIPKKLLVCAPSNAAVDELVMRLMRGIKTYNGDTHEISVVRLGKSDNINPKVMKVTLDELVNQRMNTAVEKPAEGDGISKIMMQHKAACDELSDLKAVLDEKRSNGQSANHEQFHSLEVLKRKKHELSNRIDQMKDSGNTFARNAEIRKNHVRQEVLDGADVLCATLCGSGHEMFRNLKIDFETVVIDEAAQSIELSALIPLKYGCSKCIMVGDPKQLPPTVLSREAARFQYEQSLFVRMQANSPTNVHLLDTQYRMHPEISTFPSQAFYDGRLLDGPNMAQLRTRPWHADQLLGPYRFFDVQGMHQNAPQGRSLINLAEVNVALRLYRRLLGTSKGYDFANKVGIITPYRSQLATLKDAFSREYGKEITNSIEFNTTDAFQGRESEVIIFSCVRASMKGIGFLSDIRRMNVGITRAKSSLWVLGNSESLKQGEFWGQLIEDAQRRTRFTSNVESISRAPVNTIPINAAATRPVDSLSVDEDVEMADAESIDANGFEASSSSHVPTWENNRSDRSSFQGSSDSPTGQAGMQNLSSSFKHDHGYEKSEIQSKATTNTMNDMKKVDTTVDDLPSSLHPAVSEEKVERKRNLSSPTDTPRDLKLPKTEGANTKESNTASAPQPGTQKPRPVLVRKQKEVDIFIKPKPRRRP